MKNSVWALAAILALSPIAAPAQTVTPAGASAANAQAVQGVTGGVAVPVKLQDGSGTSLTSTSINSKQRLDVNLAGETVPGATAPTYMDMVGGTDGTNARAFSVDTSGRLNTNVNGSVAVTGTFWQATQPVNATQVNGVALGSPSAYGTSPGAVTVPGVNAAVTNTVTITGSANVNATASASGETTGTLIAPATPAATSLKASAGRLYWITAGNSGASDVWVKVFNAASVTLGTTSAALNLYVPKGTTQHFVWSDIGVYLATGDQIAVTGAISLTDNTAITASTVVVNYGFQ
jgi:hypothetical protein